MSATEQIYAWLGGVRSDLIKEYQTRGHSASGNWGRSLETEAIETPRGYTATIYGAPYSGIMETGRLPNKRQDMESLRAWAGWAGSTFLAEWVEVKGITLNPYAVAWKIAREGVKVPNANNKGDMVASVVTSERIKELLRNLTTYMISELRSDVIRNLKPQSTPQNNTGNGSN